MKLPPAIIAMRIVEQGRTRFRIWFPLFLLWPLLLVLLVLTLIVSVIADAITALAGQRPTYTRLVVAGLGVVGETRGTHIHIQDTNRTVALTVR